MIPPTPMFRENGISSSTVVARAPIARDTAVKTSMIGARAAQFFGVLCWFADVRSVFLGLLPPICAVQQ